MPAYAAVSTRTTYMCVFVCMRERARAHAHVFASLWVRAMWVCAQSNHRPFLACAVQIFIKHASRCKHIVVCRCSVRIKHCSLHPNSPRVVASHPPVARLPFKPDPSRHLGDGSGRSWIENDRRCDSTPLQMCGVVCTGCDQIEFDLFVYALRGKMDETTDLIRTCDTHACMHCTWCLRVSVCVCAHLCMCTYTFFRKRLSSAACATGKSRSRAASASQWAHSDLVSAS